MLKYLFQKTETDASTKALCPVFFMGTFSKPKQNYIHLRRQAWLHL